MLCESRTVVHNVKPLVIQHLHSLHAGDEFRPHPQCAPHLVGAYAKAVVCLEIYFTAGERLRSAPFL